MSGNNYRGHKYTVYCPIKNCKYTSRHWVGSPDPLSEKTSVKSTLCPIHRKRLVRNKE